MPVFRDRSARAEFSDLFSQRLGDAWSRPAAWTATDLWGGFRAQAAWSQPDMAPAGDSGLPGNYQPVESAWFIPGPTAIIDTYAATPSTTGTLVVDDPNHIVAACDTPGDNDWFAVTLTAGVTYQFGQYAYAGGIPGGPAERNNAPLADAYLEIYDSTGNNLLAIADGGGPNTPSGLDALMTFQATYSGTYYVNATSYDNDGDGVGDFAGDYEIFAQTANPNTSYTTHYDISSPLHSIDWGGVLVNREHVAVRNPDGDDGPRPTGEPAANPADVVGNSLGFPGKNVIYIYFAGEGDLYANADSTIPAQVTAQDPYQYEIQALLTAAAEFSKVADIVYVSNYTLNPTTHLYERDPTIEYKPGPLGPEPGVKYATGVDGDGFDADFFYWSYPGTPGPGVSLLGSMSPPDYGDEGTAQFNSADERWNAQMLQQGGFSFVTLIHEFGHGHGLAHPHDTGGGSSIMLDGDTPSGHVEETTPFNYTLGDFDLNQGVYTMMSYEDGWQTSPYGQADTVNEGYGWLGSLMAFDIAVIQDKYGVNEDWATGNDTYVLKDVNEWGVYIDAATGQPAEHDATNQATTRDGYYVGQSTYYSSIWDAGGSSDTMIYYGARDANLDLRPATLRYESGGGGWMSYATGIYGGFTIANGVTIERAIAGSGNDVLTGNDVANFLSGGEGNDRLDGGLGADILAGGGGNDLLIGGSGAANELAGGAGNDLYYVSVQGDTVYEAAGEGNDTIRTTLNLYTLSANLDNLIFIGAGAFTGTGNDLANVVMGGSGNDLIDGGLGADSLAGFDGNDRLIGGSGAANELVGGKGNDTYVVSVQGDTVYEVAGEGNDTVETSLSFYVLAAANVENLTGTSNAGQSLVGSAGDNRITGGTGNDELQGGQGNDTYVLLNAGDSIVEQAGGGTDTIETALNYYFMNSPNVENLTFTGTGSFYGSGNAGDNVITGGAGNDTLRGGLGLDTLAGGAGSDFYLFDTAASAGNADTITGFVSGADRIQLDNAVFTALSDGGLAPGAFVVGTAAQDADDRILYDSATGNLYYDADGNGGGAAILFATLQGHPTLLASDFTVL